MGATQPIITENRTCRCEATIPPGILKGFACGNPQCWRTAVANASFDAFVADLKRQRGDEPLVAPEGA